VLDTIKKNAGGDRGGENFLGTLANDGVALSPFHDLDGQIPAELKAEVDQLAKDIASGSVKVADYLK
jgi:basic membrane protein A